MRVENLLSKLAPVLGEGHQKISYRLAYTSEINAMSLLGGPLVITKGILQTMEDAELAFVLAHELAHSLCRHGGEDLTKSFAVKAFGGLLLGDAAKLKKSADLKKAVMLETFHILSEIGFRKPYDRIQEREADALAVVLMKKAGFSPEESIAALEKLMGDEAEASALDKLFSTHPLTQDRILRIRSYLEYDAQGGDLLDSIQEDGQEMALDWHAQYCDMLERVTVNTRKVDGAPQSLWFVPGIFMKKSENYLDLLCEKFPQSNITVVEWKPESFDPEKMEYRAKFFGVHLLTLLENEGENREELILAGHSLGVLAVAEACRSLNQRGQKVRQVILMAAAIPYDSQDLLSACEEASLEPPWNLYSYQDRALKYLYRKSFHNIALGFCGADKKQARMKEFLLDSPEATKSTFKDLSVSHGFQRYLKGLVKVQAGEILETTVKYDYHKIAPPKLMGFPIPRTGATVAESYQGWFFAYYLHLPKVNLKFWQKKDADTKEKEATAPQEGEEDASTEGEQEMAKTEPALEEEAWEEPQEDSSADSLEKARQAKGFVIFNPLGEICFSAMNFEKAYAKFTEIKETLDQISQGKPFPQE